MLVLGDRSGLLPREAVQEAVALDVPVVALVERDPEGVLGRSVSAVALDLDQREEVVAQLQHGSPLGGAALGAPAVRPPGAVEALDEVEVAVVAQRVDGDLAPPLHRSHQAALVDQR